MNAIDLKYPLPTALEVAGVKPGRFHRHYYGGALCEALSRGGQLTEHLLMRPQETESGKGGRRYITECGTICLGLFFSLIDGGINSRRAIRIAQTFCFLGEAGSGIRALKRNRMRPAGELFPGNDDTWLVVIVDDLSNDAAECDGFAFFPRSDLSGDALLNWLDLHNAEESPATMLNLSLLSKRIKARLREHDFTPFPSAPDTECLITDSLSVGAFLADCAIRDDKARTPTQDFFRAYLAWHESCAGSPFMTAAGLKARDAALLEQLDTLGIQKIKSNGIMTFAGFRWRDDLTVQEYLAQA
ncbi:hypothetical protein [uncultured Ruegeria sp.]|uniref:hypothetical protein n=1 Tax=uncultured Ruegeria sp. TaxID=259304 RepID=UPI002619E616|nr:hypothetical protein [uncultured Ruegeria sp.]